MDTHVLLMLRGQEIRQAAWMGEDSDAKVPCLILGTQPAPLVAVHTQKLPLTWEGRLK